MGEVVSLGWVNTWDACRWCGYVFVSCHPTDMVRPSECPACGGDYCEQVSTCSETGSKPRITPAVWFWREHLGKRVNFPPLPEEFWDLLASVSYTKEQTNEEDE